MPSPKRSARATRGTRVDWSQLAHAAEAMRSNAYAPYSGYTVGAALLAADASGEVTLFTGANVENASYGLSICAERNAVAAAVNAGARDLRAIAVATSGPLPGSPCGMCRQVMSEFAPDMPVALVVSGRVVGRSTTKKLLPGAFTPERLATSRKSRTRSR